MNGARHTTCVFTAALTVSEADGGKGLEQGNGECDLCREGQRLHRRHVEEQAADGCIGDTCALELGKLERVEIDKVAHISSWVIRDHGGQPCA